jgi:hypothetical protein
MELICYNVHNCGCYFGRNYIITTIFESMKHFARPLTLIIGIFLFLSAYAFQDPNNLFLVDVDNVYNVDLAGKKGGVPSVGDRPLSAEEILMYEVLNCRWEQGRWVRYTANAGAKGTIKVGHPYLQPGNTRIFFISNIPGGVGGYDIYYADKKNGKWSEPTNMGLKVNTASDELFPFVTDAGILQIYRNSIQVNFDLAEVLGDARKLVEKMEAAAPAMSTTPPPASPPVVKTAPAKVVENVPVVPSPTVNQGLEYRVQLGSFSNPNWVVLNQLKDLGELNTLTTANGLTSVHLGTFRTLEAAQLFLPRVRARPGFENAYVVGVQNGQVVSIHKQ